MSNDPHPAMEGGLAPASTRLRGLAARALELAVLPAVEPARLREFLDCYAMGTAAAGAGADLPALRLELVDVARALLAADAPDELLATILRQGRIRRWVDRLLETQAVAVSKQEAAALAHLFHRVRDVRVATSTEATSAPSTGGDPALALAQDARDFADAPVEALRDAQRLVRVLAVARRAAEDPDVGRDAARDLLDMPVRVFADLAAAPAAEDELPGDAEPAALLQARLSFIDEIQWAFGALAGEADAQARVDRLLVSARRLLGVPLAVALAEPDNALVLHGAAGLEGTRISLEGSRGAAAMALATAAPQTLEQMADANVIDRQIARRLDADALLALPMFAPQAVGVIMLPGDCDRFGALALAAFAAPVLWLPIQLRRQADTAGRNLRSRYEQRLRDVVHEANNPLSVIHNYLHILGGRLEDEASSREQLRLIGEEIRRTSEILQALVSVPSGIEDGAQDVSGVIVLNALIRDLVGLMEPALMDAAGIRVDLQLDSADAELRLDGGRLRQVLLNLLKNAVEAMPEGGRIELRTRSSIVMTSGPGIEISITDSGPGLAPDLLAELFDMGSTTKGPGRGLGLDIVRRLIEELGGTISAQSSEGVGTSFRILLPRR